MATETVINRPAPFVEDIGKKLAEQSLALQNVPVVTTGASGLSQMPGETAEGFKARQQAAQAFDVRKQNLAGLAPQVAGQDALQQAAQQRAIAGLAGAQLGQAQFQTGLASLVPGLQRADVGQLGALGAIDRSLDQAQLDAGRQARQQAAFMPQQQLDRYASQVTGLMGGYPGGTRQEFIPQPTPLQSALGIATTLGGLYLGSR